MDVVIEKFKTLETVPDVDLRKYSGTWYEMASYPQRFHKGCHCTTTEYTFESDYIIIEKRCNKDSIYGRVLYTRGKAFVEKNSGNAKLNVKLFWPFTGKYWIIDLAADYSYAVVSHPSRKKLWILSRKRSMEDSIYTQIISRLKGLGFNLENLRLTPHF